MHTQLVIAHTHSASVAHQPKIQHQRPETFMCGSVCMCMCVCAKMLTHASTGVSERWKTLKALTLKPSSNGKRSDCLFSLNEHCREIHLVRVDFSSREAFWILLYWKIIKMGVSLRPRTRALCERDANLWIFNIHYFLKSVGEVRMRLLVFWKQPAVTMGTAWKRLLAEKMSH